MKANRNDPSHLAFIRQLPCLKCGGNALAAHLRKGTDGGTGIKPSDCWALPLCHECHSYQHQIGEQRFYKDLDKARQLARNLYLMSGDLFNCINIVSIARCSLF